jgi:hypothetical protein
VREAAFKEAALPNIKVFTISHSALLTFHFDDSVFIPLALLDFIQYVFIEQLL